MAAPGPKLELRQSQSLVMTQQLQQSIKLLQLSAMELTEYLAEELEKNPLLSLEGGEEAGEGERPAAESREAEDAGAGEEESGEEWSAAREESPADDGGASLDMPEDSGWNEPDYAEG